MSGGDCQLCVATHRMVGATANLLMFYFDAEPELRGRIEASVRSSAEGLVVAAEMFAARPFLNGNAAP